MTMCIVDLMNGLYWTMMIGTILGLEDRWGGACWQWEPTAHPLNFEMVRGQWWWRLQMHFVQAGAKVIWSLWMKEIMGWDIGVFSNQAPIIITRLSFTSPKTALLSGPFWIDGHSINGFLSHTLLGALPMNGDEQN